MATPLQVVQHDPDTEVVEALEHLLSEARLGHITGFAYVTLEPGASYSADVLGRARTVPILALGITKALENAIAQKLK